MVWYFPTIPNPIFCEAGVTTYILKTIQWLNIILWDYGSV